MTTFIHAAGSALMMLAVTASGLANAQAPSTPPVQVQPLGEERYRIGDIIVDKASARFTVPGKIVELGSADAPLEFVAGTRGGLKLYETLIELDADAVEFNVACILIGLDAEKGRPARHHFDREPVAGMAVGLTVRWRDGDSTVSRSAAQLIRTETGTPGDDWVYTGSITRDGRFMAQEHGTLVGFVHAPESLIEHRSGIGLGDYGAAVVNRDVAPPANTAVEFIVEVRGAR